jgi:serine phosphatase RsbU (regulator of sigma subunit)
MRTAAVLPGRSVRDRGGERMPDLGGSSGLLADLMRRSHVLAPVDLVAAASEAARPYGFDDIVIYVTDYAQERLVPLPATGAVAASRDYAAADSVPIDGSVAGRAYSRLELVEAELHGRARCFAPVVSGMERLGVLGAAVEGPGCDREVLADLAALVGQLLISKGLHSDYLERARRLAPMSLAAEMQWALLPPLTFGSESVVISGLLEPCYEVGGDAFDYALDSGEAVVGIFDAMGHGVEASLLSSLAIGAYRNSRRIGLDLADTYTEIDRVLSRHRPDEFVTGVFGRLDLATGRFRWVNAGHLPPLLLRGGRVVRVLETEPSLPLGLGDGPPVPAEEALEPGDRLLVFTDGVVDARSPDGEVFGEARLIDMLRRTTASGYSAAEALRRLKGEILAHQKGHLADDATILFVEWQTRGALPYEAPASLPNH